MSYKDYNFAEDTKIKHKKIVLKEKKSEITFDNNMQLEIRKIKTDDNSIEQLRKVKKCDYLLIKPDETEYYIELKGCRTEDAIDQLQSAIKFFTLSDKTAKKAFIISCRSPLSSADIQNRQRKFKNDYKSELIVKNSPFTYSIS